MALITSYNFPGLYDEDHSIDVPDWRGLEPMLLAVGSTMRRAPCRRPSPARPRASSFSTAWLAHPTASTMIYRCSSFAGRPRRRKPASAVAHQRWLDREAVNTSASSCPTSAAPDAAAV
ncbi:MAG: hypothetical protein ACLTYW_04500 [Collinsella sp.]